MFESFFPRPKLFLASALVWSVLAVSIWYWFGDTIGTNLGFLDTTENLQAPVGLEYFITPHLVWFYVYYAISGTAFAAFWFYRAPHKWQWWSIGGSLLILFSTYLSVQVSVALNNWRRPFFDAVQNALSATPTATAVELYGLIAVFTRIAFVWLVVYVLTRFFVSHFIFRWRSAMNDFYMQRWAHVRHIEGASQRVQEDTMRFASIMENLGVSVIESVMTLFAFLPVLFSLSSYVSELPVVGDIAAPLLNASIFWSIFGTILLALVGIKLPGLEFNNQRVEAAYRKELVYGEDDQAHARPPAVKVLFGSVRKNYFRLYFHYMYFNIFRGMYLQADNIFAYLILIPTIAAGAVTFGILQQILSAFGQVSNSFQYLVNSWTTIVELMSIHKRLQAFEAALRGRTLVNNDQELPNQHEKIPIDNKTIDTAKQVAPG